MDWTTWTVYAATSLLICLSPGPAVLLVVSQGIRGGRSGVFGSVLGIETANTFYFALSGTGLGVLLAASPQVFAWVRWAGAAYLVYLALVAWKATGPRHAVGPEASASTGARRALLGALLMQLSNPKALLFFGAVLPQFLDRGAPILRQVLVLGITSIGIEIGILLAYGFGAARAALHPRCAAIAGRLSGALLVGAAAGMIWLHQ